MCGYSGSRRREFEVHGEAAIDGEYRIRLVCYCETLMNPKDDNPSGNLLIFIFNLKFINIVKNSKCVILVGVSGEVARTLVEFLEVAITMIVFLKGFYPSGELKKWNCV